MEIKLLKEELEYIPDFGGDFILEKLEYLNHFPELAKLKTSGNKLMFHIVKLNPEAYYMPYVPIEIDVVTLIVLNVCILAISYLTLLGPSHIISSIKPTTTMRFE